MDDLGQRGRVEPGGRDDVCSALFLEEEGQPEGQVGPVGRSKGWGFSLERKKVSK